MDNSVCADDRLHVDVGVSGQFVDAVTRNRVADECSGRTLVFEAKNGGMVPAAAMRMTTPRPQSPEYGCRLP